jgi:hypothetical protein
MSGQTFADELPSAYSEQYGSGKLRDPTGPEPMETWVIEDTHKYVEKNIATLKAQTQDVWRWE